MKRACTISLTANIAMYFEKYGIGYSIWNCILNLVVFDLVDPKFFSAVTSDLSATYRASAFLEVEVTGTGRYW